MLKWIHFQTVNIFGWHSHSELSDPTEVTSQLYVLHIAGIQYFTDTYTE